MLLATSRALALISAVLAGAESLVVLTATPRAGRVRLAPWGRVGSRTTSALADARDVRPAWAFVSGIGFSPSGIAAAVARGGRSPATGARCPSPVAGAAGGGVEPMPATSPGIRPSARGAAVLEPSSCSALTRVSVRSDGHPELACAPCTGVVVPAGPAVSAPSLDRPTASGCNGACCACAPVAATRARICVTSGPVGRLAIAACVAFASTPTSMGTSCTGRSVPVRGVVLPPTGSGLAGRSSPRTPSPRICAASASANACPPGGAGVAVPAVVCAMVGVDAAGGASNRSSKRFIWAVSVQNAGQPA